MGRIGGPPELIYGTRAGPGPGPPYVAAILELAVHNYDAVEAHWMYSEFRGSIPY